MTLLKFALVYLCLSLCGRRARDATENSMCIYESDGLCIMSFSQIRSLTFSGKREHKPECVCVCEERTKTSLH